jgi:ssDNA-binding Zn-finger/Zn-ribbon topoisomerase 1
VTLFKQTYVSFGNKSAKRHIDTKVTDTYINKKVFTTIITCLDIECDNYSKQLDNNTKKCPLCGKRKYKTRALADMKTCSNVECENYGHELKGEMEICSLCGGTMEKFIINYNPVWSTAAISISIISAIVFCFIYGLNSGETLGGIVDSLRNVILLANIVMGIMSKHKYAIFISIAAALFTMGFITSLLSM